MERIAIAMQDGGAGAGARHEAAARAARPTSSCLAAEPLWGPPGRGDFLVSNFHHCWIDRAQVVRADGSSHLLRCVSPLLAQSRLSDTPARLSAFGGKADI